MTQQTIETQAAPIEADSVVVSGAVELEPVDDVLELQRITARTARLRAAKDELRAAFEYAQVLTHSTAINPEFQAYAERIKRRKVNGQWKTETLPALGEQAIYNLAVAIIYGDKLGWTPEESGMRVFSVHGKPSIEAKDAVAFITAFIELRLADGRTRPFVEGGDWIWQVEASPTKAVWMSRRNGVEVSSEWTMDRAQQAQYTANEKYQTNPTEMLSWKAAMEVARIQWMDVLRGIAYSREELELESGPVSVMSQRPANRKGVGGLEAMLAERKIKPAVEASADPPPADQLVEPAPIPAPDETLSASMASARQLAEVKRVLAVAEKLTDPSHEDALLLVGALIDREITGISELTETEADTVIAELTKKEN